ncbi:selenium binding protein [Lacticaseibacillus camelliae]|uniref:selenium binding protein n=1 Tax=Lacticaseibacillus camelliae TaxID=381742 RepID=UPI0012E30A25|nr:selenium binding protein [Lacticaseibacillus camelliae]
MPSEELRMLVGTSIITFNSNTQFLIENFLAKAMPKNEDWWTLTDVEAGVVYERCHQFLVDLHRNDIADMFFDLVQRRNRIVHCFQFSHSDGSQALATLTRRTHQQFEIDKAYLLRFIKDNESLALLLDDFRNQGS